MPSDSSVKIYKASKNLQKKAGKGRIKNNKIVCVEKYTKNNIEDFYTFAKENLDDFEKEILNFVGNKGIINQKDSVHNLIIPLYQLKSVAPLFQFYLVGKIAEILSNFIQKINCFDSKSIKIISAYHQILYVIVSNNMTGDGGIQGKKLVKELTDSCEKYFHEDV